MAKNRKTKTKTKTKAAMKAANNNKTEVAPPVAALEFTEAMNGFKATALLWHRSTTAVVASATVCMIVAAHLPNEKDRSNYDATVDKLRKAVAERGLQEAQVHRYIGLARALVTHLTSAKTKAGGPVFDVLACTTHDEAVESIIGYLTAHKVKSLDAIGVLVGKYKRSPRRAPVGTPPAAPAPRNGPQAGPETGPETASPSTAPGNGGTTEDPHRSGPRVNLMGLEPEEVVMQATKAGIAPILIGKAVVGFLTDMDELSLLVRMATARAEHLSSTVTLLPHLQRQEAAKATEGKAPAAPSVRTRTRARVAA